MNVSSEARSTVPSLEQLADRLYAAVVSDALDALGSTSHVLDHRIRPVARLERPLIGRAATARSIPVDARPERPYSVLLEAVGSLQAGEVWVVAGDGQTRSGVFGGLLATAARARAAVGCIVDGGVRDTREIERLGFPTFATTSSPADSYGRDEVVEFGEPIVCGGVHIAPGDLIVADHDGIVAIPAALEQRVIEHALAKVDGEGDMRGDLASGLPVAEAFTKYGIL